MEERFLQLPDEHQLQLIYAEFDTDEAKTKEKVRELIKWLEDQPHLPNVKNEFFLRNYILRCKNDMDRTRKTLERFYVLKAKTPDLFTDRSVCSESFVKCFKLATYVPLPKLTPEGYRVSIYKVNGRLDSKMPSSTEFVKNMQIVGLTALNLDFQRKSIVICDLQDISLPFITLMLWSLRRLLNMSTKVTPYRFHKIYIINAIAAISPILALVKTFAKKEIADRIEIWTKEAKDFVEVLPADVLPSDYGGSGKSFDELSNLWLDELKRQEDWLKEEERDVADLKVKHKKTSKTIITPCEKEQDDVCFRELNLD